MLEKADCGCGRISVCHSMVLMLWWRGVWRGFPFRYQALRSLCWMFYVTYRPWRVKLERESSDGMPCPHRGAAWQDAPGGKIKLRGFGSEAPNGVASSTAVAGFPGNRIWSKAPS